MNGEFAAEIEPVVDQGISADRLAALFDTHFPRLYRLARRLAPTADDALDLVQETFVRAARKPAAVPVDTTDQEAWLVRVLVNLCRDHWRKSQVRARYAKASAPQAARSFHSSEAALVAHTAVWQALDTLPPRRRAVVVMFELEGLAVSEISRLLKISAVTVRWHLSKGKRELCRALKVDTGEKKP